MSAISAKVPEIKQETHKIKGVPLHVTRSLLCYWAVRELGVTMTSLSRLLNISVQAIGKSVIRGEKTAKAEKYSLTGK